MERQVKDYFTGRMFKRQFTPAIISAVGLALGDMADAVVVGRRMGVTGLAAISLALPLFFASYILNYYLRNDDNQKLAGFGFTVGNLSDIALNMILVLFLNMGAAGAAWSTLIGQMVSICFYLPGLFGKRSKSLRLFPLRPDFKGTLKCFRVGFSSSVQYLFSMAFILISNNVLLRLSGDVGGAVFDMVQNASFLILYLYDGTAKAAQPLISTYCGEYNEEGKRQTLRTGLRWGTAATAVLVSYRVYADTMDDHYRMLTMNVAKTAAAMVDAEQVEQYTDAVTGIYFENPSPEFEDAGAEQAYLAQYDGMKDEGYGQIYHTLEKVKAANGVLSLYIVYMDSKTMTCVYVVDADDSENACPAGTWDIIYEQNYEAVKNPEGGFPAYITNTEEFGWLCSAGAAVLNGGGEAVAHAMVDISMDDVMRDRHAYLTRLCLILAAVTAVLTVIFIEVVNRAVVKPVNSLAIFRTKNVPAGKRAAPCWSGWPSTLGTRWRTYAAPSSRWRGISTATLTI